MRSERDKSRFRRAPAKMVLVAIAAFVAGLFLGSLLHEPLAGSEDQHPEARAVAEEQAWWTCSMHPQIRQPKPGQCPICSMDLIPVSSGEGDIGERQVSFSQEAVKLMQIETTPVERKFVEAEIRMVGKIDYDETRVRHITAWVPGRIDRLYVDFTGITVSKGDHMVELYSPELIGAQAELLQASKAAGNVKTTTSERVTRTAVATLEAAREKLRLLGLTDEQIGKIESSGRSVTHITIYSPMGGIVIHRNAAEGLYVETGTPIYTVADLSRLWVKLDAYESDLPWIRYGQKVEFTTEAHAGEVFEGTINFIDPVLNDKTRTVKLRVNVDNTEGKLKPGMFVRAVVHPRVAQGGKIMAPEMAGKWICPMHPAVVKTQAGACDICGMDLVTTESLGYVVDTPREAPLVIPASAPLITGTRAIVYVQVPEAEKPTFEGRQVVLGPRAGSHYIVKSGLAEGEIVVTNGNFKIDSALQIQAKPSMMSVERRRTLPAGRHSEGEREHEITQVPAEFRRQFWQVVEGYIALQKALVEDNVSEASASAGRALTSLSQLDVSLLSGKQHDVWMDRSARMNEGLDLIRQAEKIEAARAAFEELSNELISVVEKFGISKTRVLYRFHCPMSFDNRGADWLQTDKETRNPYFGASMLKCGEIVQVMGGKTE